jgi:3-oxoacyl-[acyl-carrier-protein] synthase II
VVAPKPAGEEMAKSMAMALDNAGLSADRVGYISAHGTSTQQNDADETAAIKKVFGNRARSLPISSQKSMVGHTVGGAAAIECVVTALSLYHGVLTPTINYETPDPQCDLDYVPNKARDVKGIKAAISNSFGFGGHNSTIVLQTPD